MEQTKLLSAIFISSGGGRLLQLLHRGHTHGLTGWGDCLWGDYPWDFMVCVFSIEFPPATSSDQSVSLLKLKGLLQSFKLLLGFLSQ